jgi:hypothetical protein
MGSGAAKGHAARGVTPLRLSIRLALQQREQFVRRPKLALAKARRHNRFDGL